MPHCDNCLQFFPSAMPAGCPFCDTKGFHKKAYCQFCGTSSTVVEMDKVTMQPLRPTCPTCGKGPLIPSSVELKRRLTLGPAVEPFIPTPAEVAILTEAGDADTITIDGDLLAVVRLRRTHGPIELAIQAPLIEAYFKGLYTHFPVAAPLGQKTADGLPIYGSPHGAHHPYHGLAYYPWVSSALSFYSPDGSKAYSMKGFGSDLGVPGTAGLRGNANDLSFLLTVGLTKGVTFKYTTVLDNHSILECLKTIKDGILAVYSNYMRPIDHQMVFAVRTQSVGAKAALPTVGPEIARTKMPPTARPVRG